VLKDYPSRHSIRFITVFGEEEFLMGSRFHSSLAAARVEPIKAALVMDGIGWSELEPEYMNCIWENGTDESLRVANLFDQVRQEYGLEINWRLCPIYSGQWSDNYAYWEQGYTSVLSIGGLPYLDPEYHACTDTMSRVDMQNAYLTAQENLAVLLKLDAEITDAQQYLPGESTAPTFQYIHSR
jgi:hypothetical protein